MQNNQITDTLRTSQAATKAYEDRKSDKTRNPNQEQQNAVKKNSAFNFTRKQVVRSVSRIQSQVMDRKISVQDSQSRDELSNEDVSMVNSSSVSNVPANVWLRNEIVQIMKDEPDLTEVIDEPIVQMKYEDSLLEVKNEEVSLPQEIEFKEENPFAKFKKEEIRQDLNKIISKVIDDDRTEISRLKSVLETPQTDAQLLIRNQLTEMIKNDQHLTEIIPEEIVQVQFSEQLLDHQEPIEEEVIQVSVYNPNAQANKEQIKEEIHQIITNVNDDEENGQEIIKQKSLLESESVDLRQRLQIQLAQMIKHEQGLTEIIPADIVRLPTQMLDELEELDKQASISDTQASNFITTEPNHSKQQIEFTLTDEPLQQDDQFKQEQLQSSFKDLQASPIPNSHEQQFIDDQFKISQQQQSQINKPADQNKKVQFNQQQLTPETPILLDLTRLKELDKQSKKKRTETQSHHSRKSNWSTKSYKEKTQEIALPVIGTTVVSTVGIVLSKQILKGGKSLLGLIPGVAFGIGYYLYQRSKDEQNEFLEEEDEEENNE